MKKLLSVLVCLCMVLAMLPTMALADEATAPASIKICTMLDKPSRRIMPIEVDYVGFTIEDKFVVGYGLNYGDYYRNVPYVFNVTNEDR